MDRKIKESWSKYKVITLVVPLLTLVTTIFISIYNNYYNRRGEQIDYLFKQLENKRSKLSTPLLDVIVSTLDEVPAAFSKEMIQKFLNSLPLKPSMVELSHVRGNTAKNITLDIKSSLPIKSFETVKSIEHFSVEYISSDKQQLRLSAPYLRRNTKIGVILLTDKVPNIDYSFTAEIGELFDLDKEASESEKSLEEIIKLYEIDKGLIYGRSILTFLMIEKPLPPIGNIVSIYHTNLDKEIELIERKLIMLRNESFGKWLLKFLLTRPLNLFGLSIIIILSFMIVSSFRMDWKRKKIYEETVKKIRQDKIRLGDLIYDVIKIIGPPSETRISGTREDFMLELCYFYSKDALFYRNLLLWFKFRESALVEISNGRNELLV